MDKIEKIQNGNLNDVYKLTLNNKNYIIRTTKFNNEFEVKVLMLLKKYNLNVPNLIQTFSYDSSNIMILNYIEGSEPQELTVIFVERLARLLKKLHKIPISELEYNNNYNYESLEMLIKYYDDIEKSKYMLNKNDLINSIISELKEFQIDELPKSIIHSDIKKENMLVDDNQVYLIDFGNSYIGSKLIDLIRVIMWFFLKNDNYDLKLIEHFLNNYFKDNKISEFELKSVKPLLRFCLCYNLVKDIYLYENNYLSESYIVNNDEKWYKILENNNLLDKLEEVFYNVSRYSQK